MIAALDVHYRNDRAAAGAVVFDRWTDSSPAVEYTTLLKGISPYVPGAFYKRELPALLAVLARIRETVSIIVIDGYVTLGDGSGKGLGMHLYERLGCGTPVIGVAKNRYGRIGQCRELLRGKSKNPLFISSVGISLETAVKNIAMMDGPFRIPTLLKAVDRLCREVLIAIFG